MHPSDLPTSPNPAPHQPDGSGAIERPGDSIGPYKLLQVLGEGGFGVVWLAERREPMVQRVALKIIKPGMDSRAVIARFEQERQALALMDHPNVARVLDGGVTPPSSAGGGRPYFVMELVKGEPITRFADRERLTIRERLELFIPVCEAVQHAHMKGIIHRDLKPSNILAAFVDAPASSSTTSSEAARTGIPLVKVIDFGIAKAISNTLTDKTIFTERGQLIGTPEYMSPEQAEMSSTDIDTRTDVYSLGVVLYELLSGGPPFDPHLLRSGGYAEIQRIIREVDPPKPSTRLSTADNVANSAIAGARRSEPANLARELRRELEWIPLMAMRKERDRRYSTPHALAEDVRRYLEGRALQAAPESRVYLARKFARRHRAPVVASVAVLLALCAGLAGTLWQSRVAARERDAARADRAQAVAAAEAATRARRRAEITGEFVRSALTSSDPSQGGRQGATVLASMGAAIADLDSGRFRQEPEAEADLRGVIGEIVQSNGEPELGLHQFERELELRRARKPADVSATAATLIDIANAMANLGRGEQAIRAAEEALGLSRGLAPGDTLLTAEALSALAQAQRSAGRAAESLATRRTSVEMFRSAKPGDSAELAADLQHLASSCDDMGDLPGAEKAARESLEIRRRIFRGDHPSIADGLNQLAYELESQEKFDESGELYAQALEMDRRIYKRDHPAVATALNNLAFSLAARGKPEEAAAMFEESLAMTRRLFPGDHPDVLVSLVNLGYTRRTQNRLDEAGDLLQNALDMALRLYKGDHPTSANCLNNLGGLRQAQGRMDEAEALFRRGLEMRERLFPGDHAEVAKSMYVLSGHLRAMHRDAEALSLAERSVAMAERVLPPGHSELAKYRANLEKCRKTAPTH